MALPSDLTNELNTAIGAGNVPALLSLLESEACCSNDTNADQFVRDNLAAVQAKFGNKIEAGLLGKVAVAVIQGEAM